MTTFRGTASTMWGAVRGAASAYTASLTSNGESWDRRSEADRLRPHNIFVVKQTHLVHATQPQRLKGVVLNKDDRRGDRIAVWLLIAVGAALALLYAWGGYNLFSGDTPVQNFKIT